MRPCLFSSELVQNLQPSAASGHPASSLLELPGVRWLQALVRAGVDESAALAGALH